VCLQIVTPTFFLLSLSLTLFFPSLSLSLLSLCAHLFVCVYLSSLALSVALARSLSLSLSFALLVSLSGGSFRMPQEESVRLNINERYTGEDNQMKRRNTRLMGAALVLSVIAVVAVVTLTSQAGQRTELAEDVAKRLGYSLARKPRQFTMLDQGEPIVAPVPAISAVAGAHAASRGAAGEANALESQISDLKKEIQAIANTKELEAKLQAKIAQDRRNDEADVAHELALQKTLAELKLLAKEKFDQINMDKEKEGGLTAEEAAQLDQQILALENSLKVSSISIHLHYGSSRNCSENSVCGAPETVQPEFSVSNSETKYRGESTVVFSRKGCIAQCHVMFRCGLFWSI